MATPEMSPIGLLVVHGVGNQPPGRHCALVGEGLRLVDGRNGPNVDSLVEANVAAMRTGYSGGPVPPYPVVVSGVSVCVVEAYWAPLSRLENAPEVDWHLELWGRLWETMRRVWKEPQILRDQPRSFAQLSWGQKALRLAVYTLMVAPMFIVGLNVVVPELFQGMNDRSHAAATPVADIITMTFGLILGASWWICCGFSAREAWEKFRSRRELQGALIGLLLGIFYALGLITWVVLRPSVIMMTGYIPLVTFGLLGVGVFLVAWGQTAVGPFRVFNRWLASPKWERWRHAVNRIGWSSAVLFPKVGLESIKSVGHLLEVLIIHPSIWVRLQALLALVKVYMVTIGLLVFSYILFFLPLSLLFEVVKWFLGPRWGFAYQEDILGLGIGLAIIYLILIRLAGGMLDFILDVANYHLADKEDRRRYWQKLDEAVDQLAECGEIHILAHSLGSVIAYDWLQERQNQSPPVAAMYTVGSPLEKFWYVDHDDQQRRQDEGSAIGKPDRIWVNFWAVTDLVSGSLRRYGWSERRRVTNIHKLWFVPLVSHVFYWKDPEVLRTIRSGIVNAWTDRFKEAS